MTVRTPNKTRDVILTYDLGTTRIKVALFTTRGRLVGQRAARHQELRQNDRAWQDADAWWSDAVRLTRELLAAKPGRVIAISVSGRGGAAVFVGRDGTVIGQPWSDRRHSAELKALNEWRTGGAHVSNYAAALLSKKQWFVANEPTRARQLRHVLYAKDFLIFRLTGQAVTDPSSGPDAPAWDARRARAHRLYEPGAARCVAVGRRRAAGCTRRNRAGTRRRHSGRRRRARRHLRKRRLRCGFSGRVCDHARHTRGRSCHPPRHPRRIVPLLRPAARPTRDRRQCGDGRPRRGLVPGPDLRRQRPRTGAAFRRHGRGRRTRAGRVPAACGSCRFCRARSRPNRDPAQARCSRDCARRTIATTPIARCSRAAHLRSARFSTRSTRGAATRR